MSVYRLKDGSQTPSRFIRYVCPNCDSLHASSDGAKECCYPDPDPVNVCPVCKKIHTTPEDAMGCHSHAGEGDLPATICPTCGESHFDIDYAVNCCQWKRFDFGERARISLRLATSSAKPIWTEAICKEYGITITQLIPEDEDACN